VTYDLYDRPITWRPAVRDYYSVYGFVGSAYSAQSYFYHISSIIIPYFASFVKAMYSSKGLVTHHLPSVVMVLL